MLANYFKIALRTLWKHRGYAFINVAGLAVGMACCVLIVLFIQHELRYDRFHAQADAIYRVTVDLKLPGAEFQVATTMVPLAPALTADLPEVVRDVRVSRPGERLVAVGDRRYYEEGFTFVDSTFFDVFTYPLARGDAGTALDDPFSVVLTEAAAQRYFGGADPVGRMLRVDDTYDFTVTGVLAPSPGPSHLVFDFLASFVTQRAMGEEDVSWNSISGTHTYVVLADPAVASIVEAKLPAVLATYLEEEDLDVFALHLQPLRRIHLHSDFANEDADIGDASALYVLGSIALLILLIAGINFVNLSTARSVQRAREVGMRKVLGALRAQLVGQFLGESLLLAVGALLLAMGLIEVLLPGFNRLLDVDLVVAYSRNGVLLAALLGITLFVGVVAGSYPAFVLSSFRPVQVLKGRSRRGLRGEGLRQTLVVVQFAIAVMLIVGSVVMAAQMAYFEKKDLGFHGDQVVVVPLRDAHLQAEAASFKERLVRNDGVLSVAAASHMPGQNSYSLSDYRPEGRPDAAAVGLRTIFFDPDMVETFAFDVVGGRTFSDDFPTDTAEAVLLNESAARYLGWTDPLGKTLTTDGRIFHVIGVLKDVHYSTLQQQIEPVVFRYDPDVFRYLAVRLRPDAVPETLAFLEEQWRTAAPAYPFEYRFVDDEYALHYDSTQRQSRTIHAFTLLAIVVACLGLFGLVAYTTEQRTKEIGVRKVLGASVPGILVLLAKDALKLVGIAFVVAAPLAYVVMDRWLSDFAYRIEISWRIFLMAGLLALLVTLCTVGYQAVRAAVANPVKSLRYE